MFNPQIYKIMVKFKIGDMVFWKTVNGFASGVITSCYTEHYFMCQLPDGLNMCVEDRCLYHV